MTLVSSGNQILLQGTSDTNPSTTTSSVLNNTSFAASEDSLVYIQRSYEVPGGDDFEDETEWYGSVLGYHRASNGFMGGGFVYSGFNNIISALPFQTYGTRDGLATFVGEPGAMGNTTATYTDGGGTSRTIDAIIWGNPATNSADQSHWFLFALSGTSVPNNDNTFKSIVINPSSSNDTYTFNRSSANVYDTGENGRSVWIWDNQTSNVNAMTTSVVTSMHIQGPDTTTTLNTGIAEEMGGADSSDVKMSDYYKNGTFIGELTGLPTSGEIKFSDFYSKTHVGLQLTSGTMTNGYNSGGQYVPPQSGYADSISMGSWSGRSFTYDGDTVEINDLRNFSGQMFLSFYRTDNSQGSFNNSGWTSMKIYLNQTNNSGSPDLTLNRTSATFTGSATNSTYAMWTWGTTNTYSLSSYFGTSTGNQHYIEIV